MSFLAPGFFLASLAVAAATVALHFIVTRQPRAAVLPTARFVPDLPATAISRATRPSDLALLLLRVLLVLAAGAGLARPVLTPSRANEARVILVDRSSAVTDTAALRDSALAALRDGDALVLFDSTARRVVTGARDSLMTLSAGDASGNLSAALITALRAGSSLRERADSVELVIISPLVAEEFDAATDSIRTMWKGRARVVRVGNTSPAGPGIGQRVVTTAEPGDPILAALERADRSGSAPLDAGTVLLARGAVSSVDSSSVVSVGGALVGWPAAGRAPGTVPAVSNGTSGGVVTDSAVVIAPFTRAWNYAADSILGASVIARWIDGSPAAIETRVGAGCVRSVALPVPAAGDLVLRDDFSRMVRDLTRPCTHRRLVLPADEQTVTALAGSGGLASRDAFPPRGDVRSRLAPWLIALALALALAELFVRKRITASTAAARNTPQRKAA